MTKRSRILAAAAVPGLLVGSLMISDQASAGVGDPVLNPGPVTMTVDAGGFFNVAGNELSLPSVATEPQCSDGLNNDVAVDDPTKQQDLNIDFDGGASHGVTPVTANDAQCNAGGGNTAAQDDSEVKPGNQPREYVTLQGNVAADGTISVPQGNISFPTFYVFSSQANGVIDVFPSPTGPATGTLDPATGVANLSVDWQLRIVQAFFKIDCTSAISMALSSDPGDPANSGAIGVNPQPYNTTDGSVTVSGNTFPVDAFLPTGLQSGTTGQATASSLTFTDPNGSFVAGNWTPTGGGDVGKSITIAGAGAGGADFTTSITAVNSATSVTLKAAPSTSVDPASYDYAASSQALCDTVGGGFGITPGSGAAAGASAAELSVTSDVAFESGIAPAPVSGTVTAAGSGDPVSGVFVTLMYPNPSWNVVDTTTTDVNGNYQFDSVPDGDYQIRFFDGSGTYQRTWYSNKNTYLTADVVSVSGGASAPADQVLELIPPADLSGRALNSSNVGIPGIRVLVFSETDGFYASAVTGANGYYLLRGVPAGNYLIQFVDPTHTYRQQWYNFKALAFNADPVAVGTSTVWASALMGA